MIPSGSTRWPCASTTLPAPAASPCFSWTILPAEKIIRRKLLPLSRAWRKAAVQSEAALIGGETAEHPGLMAEDEYDLAGFAVGVCDRKDMITGENLKPGDVLSGHGFLRRSQQRIFPGEKGIFERRGKLWRPYYEELGCTLGEALLAPTKIYVKALKAREGGGRHASKAAAISPAADFMKIFPGCCRKECGPWSRKTAIRFPPIFRMLQKRATSRRADDVQYLQHGHRHGRGGGCSRMWTRPRTAIEAAGETAYVIGRIESGEKGVDLC